MTNLIDSKVRKVYVRGGCGSYTTYIDLPIEGEVSIAYFPKSVEGREQANNLASKIGKLLKAEIEEY